MQVQTTSPRGNNGKKILKQVKKLSPNTKVVFSSIVTRKDKKDISKTVQPEKYRFYPE